MLLLHPVQVFLTAAAVLGPEQQVVAVLHSNYLHFLELQISKYLLRWLLVTNTVYFFLRGGRERYCGFSYFFWSPTWCIKLLSFITDNLSKLRLVKCLRKIKTQ